MRKTETGISSRLVVIALLVGWSSLVAAAKEKDPDIGKAVYFGDNILKNYHPDPALVVQEHPTPKPRFAVIDVHTHFSLDADPEAMIAAMDDIGIKRVVNLSGGNGDDLEDMLEKFYEPWPERFAIFYNIDFSTIDEPDFGARTAELIREAHEQGVKGLKIFKSFGLTIKDESGRIVPIDDRRMDPVWDVLAQLGLPVLMHTADPAAFFQKIDGNNERWLQLARHPGWSFYGDEFPSREDLFEQREHVLQRHPDLKVIGAHVGSYADDLKSAAEMLDKYPNFYVEIAGRASALGRQPYSAREFMIRYQDRIMFGTDRYPGRTDQPRYKIYYRFLETADEYFDYYDHPFPPSGEWKIYGLYLDDAVLKKIYYENAQRILGY